MCTFSSRPVHSRRIQCALFDLMWGCLLTQSHRHGNNDFQRGSDDAGSDIGCCSSQAVDSDGPTSCPLAAILLPFLTLLGEDGKEDDIGEDRG